VEIYLFRLSGAVDSWVKPHRHRDGHENDLMSILIAFDQRNFEVRMNFALKTFKEKLQP